jgi:hypothetical protein
LDRVASRYAVAYGPGVASSSDRVSSRIMAAP